jgi:UDP-GlcNAc:undecaprenyl-phosphate/decaprenyl-phosphate GlcNAc-1-phosphate transferase
MTSAIFMAIVAVILCIVVTPFVRHLSAKLGVVDTPDGGRKVHHASVPRTGGVAIAFSYLLSLGAPFAAGWVDPSIDRELIARNLIPASVIFFVGLIDDVRSLRSYQKLAGQVAAAILAYGLGLKITGVAGVVFDPVLSFFLTIFWLVGCANAFNLIDGVDGLAAGVGVVATSTMFVAAILQNNPSLAIATLPLAGALIGFLRYNFNPASIFLGDSGSLLIGFLLGSCGIVWSQKSATLLGLTAPCMALALPLFDVGLSVTRRFLRRQPIFTPDRGHIHHRLLEAGMSPRHTALSLYSVCVGAAIFSLLQTTVEGRFSGLIVLGFAVLAAFAVHLLRYEEFVGLWNALTRDVLRSSIVVHVHARRLEQAIGQARSSSEVLEALERHRPDLGFDDLSAQLHERPQSVRVVPFVRPGVSEGGLKMMLPLGSHGFLVCAKKGAPDPVVTRALEELSKLQIVLTAKLDSLQTASMLEECSATQDLLALAHGTGIVVPVEATRKLAESL